MSDQPTIQQHPQQPPNPALQLGSLQLLMRLRWLWSVLLTLLFLIQYLSIWRWCVLHWRQDYSFLESLQLRNLAESLPLLLPLLVPAVVFVLLNLVWMPVVRARSARVAAGDAVDFSNIAVLQLMLDVIVWLAVIQTTGGWMTPFVGAIVLELWLVGVVLTRRIAYIYGVLVAAIFMSLAAFDTFYSYFYWGNNFIGEVNDSSYDVHAAAGSLAMGLVVIPILFLGSVISGKKAAGGAQIVLLEWLVKLRWFQTGLFAVLAGVILVLPLYDEWRPSPNLVLVALPVIVSFCLNLICVGLIVDYRDKPQAVTGIKYNRFIFLQLFTDLVMLLIAMHVSGGWSNVLIGGVILNLLIASAALKRGAVAYLIAAIFAMLILILGEIPTYFSRALLGTAPRSDWYSMYQFVICGMPVRGCGNPASEALRAAKMLAFGAVFVVPVLVLAHLFGKRLAALGGTKS